MTRTKRRKRPNKRTERTGKAQIFVDTGAWVARAVEDDAHHEEAARVYPDLLKKYRLITTNLGVAERDS